MEQQQNIIEKARSLGLTERPQSEFNLEEFKRNVERLEEKVNSNPSKHKTLTPKAKQAKKAKRRAVKQARKNNR